VLFVVVLYAPGFLQAVTAYLLAWTLLLVTPATRTSCAGSPTCHGRCGASSGQFSPCSRAGQGDWLRPIESAAGMHLTALLPRGRHLSPQEVLELTDGSGVAVNSLAAFYAADVTESGLVLGYGAVPLHQIEDGLQLLRHLLDCS
jgi:hypothetical protein